MGLAKAKAFAEAGASVPCPTPTTTLCALPNDELTSAGHKAIGVHCDVAEEAEVAAMVEQGVSAFGRLDAAFNNGRRAGASGDTADALGSDFDPVNGINLHGVWNCMKYELRQMRQQGSGAIVNCSSLGGLVGLPFRAIYPKRGVIGLTKSAALE